MKVIYFDELESTNDEAMQGSYVHGDVIVARKQSAGRGQRGNKWISEPGENLTFSIVVEPHHMPVVEQYRISMMAVLAASDAIGDMGVECMIKWSNDLYAADKKIGGILIEHCFSGPYLDKSIIGIGINVLQQSFPTELPNATSMLCVKPGNYDIEIVLAQVFKRFEQRYKESVSELYRDYMSRLWRGDGVYDFADVNGCFKASIYDVEPLSGRLTLQVVDGERREYWFKEVEFL